MILWFCFIKEQNNTSLPPSLVTLDTTNPGLTNDLEMLDTITARDNDTVHVFYVKSGQRLAQDILRNVVSCYVVSFIGKIHIGSGYYTQGLQSKESIVQWLLFISYTSKWYQEQVIK